MSSASRAISACSVSRMDPPTILRVCRSRTAARNSQPSPVRTQVRSPSQTWFGRAASKLRPSRFGAIGYPCRPVGGAHPARQGGQPPQPRLPHQARHAVAANLPAEGMEHGVDTRGAIGPTAFGMGQADVAEQGSVLDRPAALGPGPPCPAALGPGPPCVVPAHRHPQDPAHHSNRPDVPMLIHEPEPHRVAPPKMSAAFFEACRAPSSRDRARASAARSQPPGRPGTSPAAQGPSSAAAPSPFPARRTSGASASAPSRAARAPRPTAMIVIPLVRTRSTASRLNASGNSRRRRPSPISRSSKVSRPYSKRPPIPGRIR